MSKRTSPTDQHEGLRDRVDYLGVALIILGGIGPLAVSSRVELPPWVLWLAGLAIMGCTALQNVWRKRLEEKALHTPTAREGELEAIVRDLYARVGSTPHAPSVPAPPTEGETLPGYRVGDVHE